MELLVVANPVSGGGRAGRTARALTERFDGRPVRAELMLTRHAGHAAERLRGGPLPDRIVAVGGDGTVNEIVNGLLDRDDRAALPPIAVVPTGTANVLARELGLPHDLIRAARLAERGRTMPLDVGDARLDDGARRLFVCMAGVGFDGLVTRLVAERRTGTQGFAAYAAPIRRAIREYRPPELRVAIDDGAPIAAGWLLASLVRNYGGLFTLADGARPGSGRFQVLALGDARRRRLVRLAVAGLLGGASGVRGVAAGSGRSLRIESAAEGEVDIQVDGDRIGTTPLSIELLAGAIRVVVPD